MKKSIFTTIFFLVSIIGSAQLCNLAIDYSSNSGWTQIGTDVEINNGKLNYLNGAADNQQRRVYRNIGTTLNANDTWSAEFDFLPTSTGSWGGPATGHTLFALTAGNQEPFNDCPNVSCSGLPTGNQDGVIITYVTTNPTDPANHVSNTIFFKIHAKDGTTEYRSANILTGTSMNTNYYLRVERIDSITIQLSVFSDPTRTTHLPNSPLTLTIPSTVDGLTTLQHGNVVRGDSRRQLTGTIDNLCFSYNSATSIPDLTENNLNIRLFPNPTKDMISFTGLSTNHIIQIHNLAGKLVLETTNQSRISVGEFASGIYFARIQNEGKVYLRKFIVE